MDEHNQGIFSHYQKNFYNFQKILFPANCAPVTSPDIRMHPKTIVSTSHQNLNNSVKIAAENSQSVLYSHVPVHKHHKNPQAILKNSRKKKKPHNSITNKRLTFFTQFQILLMFNHGENRKKLMQAKKMFVFERFQLIPKIVQKQSFKNSTKQVVPDKSIKSHLEISVSASWHWHWCQYRHRLSNINIVYYTI